MSTPPPAGARGPSPGPQPGGPGFQMPMMMGPGGPAMMGPNGQMMRPSPEQIRMLQQKLAEDAQKAGMTVPQFVEQLKKNAMAQQQQQARMMAAQQQGGAGPGAPGGPTGAGQGGPRPGGPAQGQPVARPIQPGPPNPVALAMAKFLRGQELKPRTVIMNGERKDMFRVKRALRALESPAYEKARKKNPALPEIKDRASLENAFKLLPMSMLALRVSKVDPDHGHNHGGKKAKRTKGLWTVKIEPQQDAHDDMYYIWMWEGSQVKRKVYGILALIVIFTIVLYPLWPLVLRQGVYYLSWGLLLLLGLFFLMAIFRVILFCVTYFVVPPGLWLFPNLWEDVSFLDSFRPVWSWHETIKPKKKKKTKAQGEAATTFSAATGQPAPATATTTATTTQVQTQVPVQRAGYVAPKVEELADDE